MCRGFDIFDVTWVIAVFISLGGGDGGGTGALSQALAGFSPGGGSGGAAPPKTLSTLHNGGISSVSTEDDEAWWRVVIGVRSRALKPLLATRAPSAPSQALMGSVRTALLKSTDLTATAEVAATGTNQSEDANHKQAPEDSRDNDHEQSSLSILLCFSQGACFQLCPLRSP